MKTIAALLFALAVSAGAQTTTDLFIMPGSDFVRPGLYARANLNIGIGYTTQRLNRSPVGNEITFGYTYENSGSHGFWHSNQGAHTEAIGLMKNINLLPPRISAYTWMQVGITSITGGPKGVQNRFYNGESLGLIYHLTDRHGIWLQGAANKVETTPWYSSVNVGYVLSW